MGFNTFDFHARITTAVASTGYSNPTPIQMQAIPKIMQRHDLIGIAQTGTGKTAAYALPLLNRLPEKTQRKTRALIIAPTRELAEQIHQDFKRFGHNSDIRSLTLYGGVGLHHQIRKLKKGADIVIACPGRLIDHIQRGNKASLPLRILANTQFGFMLILTRTKHRAKRLSEILLHAGYDSTSWQGNLSQERRQAALNGFRTGKFRIKVTRAARPMELIRREVQ